ncbi:MAG: hypothetical protein LBK58_01910 [Prevotellaceae bacterium]|jgi:hypothetical protein|nr:hypothetical protein [Prevotellaceae bacterium]
MENLVEIFVNLVNIVLNHADMFLSSLSGEGIFGITGGGITLAFALGTATQSSLTEAVLLGIRKWHGSIDDKFSNVKNVVDLIQTNQWPLPADLLKELTGYCSVLQDLIIKCRTTDASSRDRSHRNMLLQSAVGLCLLQVKTWAYGQYSAGTLTAEDIHNLGFFLPGEVGGHRSRKDPTVVMAEVKVRVISSDLVHVVVDQSAGENAAMVEHGWPTGVKNALIVITSVDTKTEVIRQMTTRLHNNIQMPEGSQGKQFVIKAAFLQHTGDTPHFGSEPTFTLPLTTEDLIHTTDRQHHEDFEAQLQEVERHRREIERIEAEMNAKKMASGQSE